MSNSLTHLMDRFLLCLMLVAALSLHAADTPINLLFIDRQEPAIVHGETTGILRYLMNDTARDAYVSRHGAYFRGEDCFKIDVKDGVATFTFPDPLPAPYAENPGKRIYLDTGLGPHPPAQTYHTTGRVRLTGGEFHLTNGMNFKPSPEWQTIDKNGGTFIISMKPAAGATISFADLQMTPVYPSIGGEIALPDGGRLNKLLLPKDANFVVRWGVAMWRGWLWRLTGTALPIETVDAVAPAEGAFAAINDPSIKRGWHLQVAKNGITLRYRNEDDIAPAMFDYFRMRLGYTMYAPDDEVMPSLPVKELPSFDRTANPRYNAIVHSAHHTVFSGGQLREIRYMKNNVDYYHATRGDWIHFLNVAMPAENYYKTHPEYFMMNARGARVVSTNHSNTQQCFSNQEARKLMVEGLADIFRAQPYLHRLCIEPGDTPVGCQCPKCLAFNGTSKSHTDILMDFSNEVARKFKEIDPKGRLYRCAYFNRCLPPQKIKPEDNIDIFFCMTEHLLPCTLHVDCERNKNLVKWASGWTKALGDDPSRLGFMTYDDLRPLQFIRFAEHLNKYASGDIYSFQWHYTPYSVRFVLPRWNLGEDADKLMEEFDRHYYGAAGDAMHRLTLFIDEYGRNYRHKKGEGKLTVLFCGVPNHAHTVFDRAAFDKMYAILDEAIAAAGNDKKVRERIFAEKKSIMVEDFGVFGPSTCVSEAESAALAKRVTDFIAMAREFPRQFGSVPPSQEMRSFLLHTTSLNIPDTGKFWANEPYIDKFLADPKSFFSEADKIPGGWYFKPLSMKGAENPFIYDYECPPRYSVVLRRKGHDNSTTTLKLTLDMAPKRVSFLAIEGQDDDKPGTSAMRVSVNGKEVFSGPCAFPEFAWGRMGLNIPAGILKAGENLIEIANITPDEPSRSARFTDKKEAANDHQWGWIVLSEAYWLEPNDEFQRYINGDFKTTIWSFHNGTNRSAAPEGIENGKAVLTVSGKGPAYHLNHKHPKLAITPGTKVRITVKASGSGKLHAALWNYLPYKKSSKEWIALAGFAGEGVNILPASKSEPFELSPEPKEFTCVLTPSKGTGLIIPRMFADKESRAEVTDFNMELIVPEPTK